jgi:hypothetical protein
MKLTQNQIILDEFKKGTRLTTYTCTTGLLITNLPKRCSELRRAGIEVRDEKVKRNGKTFKEYFL